MQQIQSTLSSKNQAVIPSKVRKALNLQAGDTIVWQIIKDGKQTKVLAEPLPKSWTEYSRGLGEHIWKDIDINKYISTLREEWKETK